MDTDPGTTTVILPLKRHLQSADIDGFDELSELALDMRSAWNHATDQLWRALDPVLWDLTHNPWVVLQTVSRENLQRVLTDPTFRRIVDTLIGARRSAAQAPAWFQKAHPGTALNCVAYFSMEFMLSEALPIYSGGLGNVAGDQLKAASDMGVPVVGVGLLYGGGYFRQVIDRDGNQRALYPYNDPGQLPILPLRQPNGEWLRLEIALPGYSVWLRTWKVQVGRVQLLLLDSNDAANYPAHRGITSELYGSDPELRLQQEMILGIGGWRLLNALHLQPEVCHLNEGHAGFAVLERALCFMQQSGKPFDVALAVTRAGNLFTTHTAVGAAFDRFDPALIARFMGAYAEQKLGISLRDLLALGRQNPDDASEPFNMAYLAVRGSGAVNGVSRLHGKVSQQLFAALFAHWPRAEVPIDAVTNGIHVPTWDSAPADELWTETCGKDRWLGTTEALAQGIRSASDARLWTFRSDARKSLVAYARQRLAREMLASGESAEAVASATEMFGNDTLTLGFARRFTSYKRPNLLLHDRERLLRLLRNAQRPVQLIIAGKAHPADQAGQALIRDWVQFIRRSDVRPHVMFLGDYDMLLTERLVQGVDVWINTPRRPWEACGTSGMKVLVNGGINLSELDGWWAEAFSPELGWALGDGAEHDDDPAWDATEAAALYDLLEREVIPQFYDRDGSGIPVAWVSRMRASMAQLTPRFSTNRTVREYTERLYLPAAAAYRERSAGNGAVGQQIVAWRRMLDQQWSAVKFGAMRIATARDQHTVEVEVFLGDIDPDAVRVELYADGSDESTMVCQPMSMARAPAKGVSPCIYRTTVPAIRPADDYTARVMPQFAGVAVPLECARIAWQR